MLDEPVTTSGKPLVRGEIVEERGWLSAHPALDDHHLSADFRQNRVRPTDLIGWQLAGLVGLLVATLAIMIPSCPLAFIAGRVIARWSERRWTKLLREGLVPLALGLILASGLSMMRVADHNTLTTIISLATAAFVILSRRHPLWAIVAGAAANMAALQFG